jgi:hypothetical protein
VPSGSECRVGPGNFTLSPSQIPDLNLSIHPARVPLRLPSSANLWAPPGMSLRWWRGSRSWAGLSWGRRVVYESNRVRRIVPIPTQWYIVRVKIPPA